MQVMDDSVAAATGIREGDVIRTAAGFETRSTTALIEVVQRQAPGTWLPLELRRGTESLEMTARFPQTFD
jgi:S1-C subfamily serine protease